MPSIKKPAAQPAFRRAVTQIRGLQLRAAGETGDGSVTIQGHAAVFDQETVLFDWGWLRVREIITPGAFADVLSREPLVHLVHEHDNKTAMASTGVTDGVGALELQEDADGLRFFARAVPDDFDVARLTKKMGPGIVSQASFAFTIAPDGLESHSTFDEDGNEDELWTITKIKDLYDVSICAQGAYPQTDSQLASRELRQYLGRATRDDGDVDAPAGPEQEDVAPDTPAVEEPVGVDDPVAPESVGGHTNDERRLHLARLRARARTAVATLTDRR